MWRLAREQGGIGCERLRACLRKCSAGHGNGQPHGPRNPFAQGTFPRIPARVGVRLAREWSGPRWFGTSGGMMPPANGQGSGNPQHHRSHSGESSPVAISLNTSRTPVMRATTSARSSIP